MRKGSIFLSTTFILCLIAFDGYSQNDKNQGGEEQVKSLIEKKNFRFSALTVNPARGRLRNLTPGNYFIAVSPDSLVVDLPFFGRAFTAPIGASSGGFNFTSPEFDYRVADTKDGGWDITLSPKKNDVRKITLLISKGGNTTAIVNSNSRQTISYNGFITARDKR
jgi:hypothetical protein